MPSFSPDTWRGRSRLLAGVISALLLLAAFPPLDLRFVAWFAFVPLFLALRGATARAGAFVGLCSGVVFFGALLYWLIPFGVVAWLPLAVAQALAWMVAGWFGAWSSHRWIGRLAGMPVIFVALEIVRERWPLGGFAWGLVGTTQHSGLPVLPLARVAGVFGVSLAILVINAALAEALGSRGWIKRVWAVILAAATAAAPAALPLGLAGRPVGLLDVASIQVNVREGTFGPQRGRQLGDEGLRIVDRFVEASESLASDPPDLVIWPENALDRDPTNDPEAGDRLRRAVAAVHRPFIAGAILDVDGDRFRNSLLLLDAEGAVTSRYDKQHLVPFGEYVPWPGLRDVIGALDQVPFDAVAGTEPVTFDVAGVRVGGVICFESTFPEVVRGFIDEGAQVIVVATNNASFGRSMAAREHLAQSRMRAVEHGRYVIHAAISGTSAIIGPDGRILRRAGLFTPATLRATVAGANGRTPYARFGAGIEAGIIVLAALAAVGGVLGLLGRRRERREISAAQEFEWGSEEGASFEDGGPGHQPGAQAHGELHEDHDPPPKEAAP